MPQVRAQPDDDKDADGYGVLAIGITAATLFATLATLGTLQWGEQVEDLLQGDGPLSDVGLGDAAAVLLWSAALYIASPLQLLLLFFGTFERSRPSDAVLAALGRAAGLDVDAVDYAAPTWARAATVMVFVASGSAVTAALNAALGDPTWGVSSGLGALAAAAVYDLGRPPRLSREQAVRLEAQWQDFTAFADQRLQRTGRCHESEVFSAFRREVSRYRDPAVLADTSLRDMLRNWAPGCERTRMGYVKGVSLVPRVDAFTGEVQGASVPTLVSEPAAGQQSTPESSNGA